MSSSLVVLVVDAYPADPPGDDRLHPADPHRPRTHHGPEVSRYVEREKKHERWRLTAPRKFSAEGVELHVCIFRPSAAVLEFLRCVAMMMMHRLGHMTPLLPSLAVPTEV